MSGKNEPVRTLLRRPAVVVDPGATLRAVAEFLADESIGAVVVRGTRPVGASGSPADGVVSERDVSRALAEGLDPDTTQARDVMTMDVACASPGETILRVAMRMLANQIRHVPIVEHGVLLGVVSERDVLRALVQELQEQGRR